MWEISKVVSKGDYDYAVVKGHPNASKYGYVLHHRVVVENKLGRLLEKHEIVHHIDGNKKNNVPENLEVMTQAEHGHHHGKDKHRTFVPLTCPVCGKDFLREKRLVQVAAPKCSRSCNGKRSRNLQLGRSSSG